MCWCETTDICQVFDNLNFFHTKKAAQVNGLLFKREGGGDYSVTSLFAFFAAFSASFAAFAAAFASALASFAASSAA